MERAEIDIAGHRHPVIRLRGQEALGEPFSYEVLCELGDDAPAPQDLSGERVIVMLRDRFGNERRVQGIVARARRMFSDIGVVLEVIVRPALWRLGLGRDHRMFSAMSALDVVERVFADAGEKLRVEIDARPKEREAIAQFDESDLALFDRLVDEEGWIWWLDHDDGSTAVLHDDVRRLPWLLEDHVLSVREDALDVHDEESLHHVEVRERSTVDAVRVLGADRDAGGSGKGGAGARVYAGSRGRGRFERIEYAGSSHGRADLDAQAALRFEALTAERRRLAAETTSVRPYPGRAITIPNDGEYVVVRVAIQIDQRRRENLEQTLRVQLELHPRDVPLRLWREKRAPQPVGVQIAEVVAEREISIDADGRVPTKMRWDRSDSSRPARVAQRPTADSALYPRGGWNVLTLPARGGLDEPTVLGRLFDAEHPPPYALPGDKTKLVYKTATTPGGGSTNEIAFDGALGREEMFVNASGDLGSAANNHDREQVKGDAKRSVGRDETLAVTGREASAVECNLTVRIAKNDELEVVGSHGLQVGGAMDERIAGTRSLHVGKEHGVNVSAKRSQKVGAVCLDTTLGAIKTEAGSSASVLTGGVRAKVARGAIAETAALGSALLVGGVRLDIGKMGVKIETKNSIRERVGGAVIMRAIRRWHQFALSYGSYKAATMKLEAPDITIDATTRILVVVSGMGSIRVDTDGVEIRGTNITAKGDMWVAEGTPQTKWNK